MPMIPADDSTSVVTELVNLVSLNAKSLLPLDKRSLVRVDHLLQGSALSFTVRVPSDPAVVGRIRGRENQNLIAIERLANSSAGVRRLTARVSLQEG